MRFHVLLPVRDEADIIGQCLARLTSWADHIYVFDTGSVDDTWEIVRAAAADDERIIPLKKEAVYFSEPRLRGWMFHQARKQMQTGDWFVRADADEFHHVAPPEFVKTSMEAHETIAYHQYYDFRLTETEVKNWEAGKETIEDRKRPIADRRRWYTVSDYSEPRLCRYRESMRWPTTVSFPFNAGFVAAKRLPIRHYPHRDPVQLERRCLLRAVMMADRENSSHWSRPELHHWAEAEWRKFVTPDSLSDLRYWRPGEELPLVERCSHLRPAPIRLVQRLIHMFALPILDRTRSGFGEGENPQPIRPEVQAQLAQVLGNEAGM